MSNKSIARNKKAFHEYSFIEKMESGIQLLGTEVKSLKTRGGSILESYAKFNKSGELFVYQMNIPQYTFANRENHDPVRPRKLLLHKRELLKLKRFQEQQGFVIVPLNVYLKRGIIKVEIGLGKGKKLFDKRESIKKRISDRHIQRSLKTRSK
ncbi:MAG: SsrA-binding protein SmpB [Candidatus Aureabacteria bacterium]|nr:SsrA-binding protein SmpB [Candidatus Auribacterota bacterium]